MVEFLSFREDDATQEPTVTVEAFTGQSNSTAVRIDGRGYSAARILREAGYAGELRAVGDVLVDQIVAMRRCGFDSFHPAKALDDEAVERALTRYADVYQKSVDGRAPIWAKRHPENIDG